MALTACMLVLMALVHATSPRETPQCDRKLLEEYQCNTTGTVPYTLKIKWEQFCQLAYCYKFENATDILTEWEQYSGLDSLFSPCDFVPFSNYEAAAIFLLIVSVPIGLAFSLYCETQENEHRHSQSLLSIHTV